MRNEAGNTLALVAAGMFPLLGLIGGGVDMSRMYLTKSRLQQACDAGALAGRKVMGSGAWSANSNAANTAADSMFDANFRSGSYGTLNGTRSFTEDDGTVTGNASADVPMTIMKVFGQGTRTIAVTCDAAMRIPNTDVMFVLDTTGSMGSKASSSDTMTKIQTLRYAVKCFYEALAKLDITDVNCGTTPSGSNGSTVQLRFGFVPYTTNVNVGALLENDWLADSWTYQSRAYERTLLPGSSSYGSWTYLSGSSNSTYYTGQSSCPRSSYSTTSDGPNYVGTTTNSDGTTTITSRETQTFNGYSISNCTSSGNGWSRTYSYTKTTYDEYVQYRDITTSTYWANAYVYRPVTYNVSSLKSGSTWPRSISLPIGTNGSNRSVSWDGCIEERKTFLNTDGDPSDEWSPIPSDAWDMDIDRIPTAGDVDSQWKPALPGVIWGRYDPSNGNSWTVDNVSTTSSLSTNYSYSCPVAARNLSKYDNSQSSSYTPTGFMNYVNSLSAGGNTYHDIGLIWGARLMSPTGLFASENAFTPAGGQIDRHMIFMTDGDTVTSTQGYGYEGIPWWDRRQTSVEMPTNDSSLLDSIVNARTTAICNAIKAKGITLWVISFGSGVSSSAQDRLRACATDSDHFYMASNSQDLIDNFRAIADAISQLRLTN